MRFPVEERFLQVRVDKTLAKPANTERVDVELPNFRTLCALRYA